MTNSANSCAHGSLRRSNGFITRSKSNKPTVHYRNRHGASASPHPSYLAPPSRAQRFARAIRRFSENLLQPLPARAVQSVARPPEEGLLRLVPRLNLLAVLL